MGMIVKDLMGRMREFKESLERDSESALFQVEF